MVLRQTRFSSGCLERLPLIETLFVYLGEGVRAKYFGEREDKNGQILANTKRSWPT